jgi:hypothetical protein
MLERRVLLSDGQIFVTSNAASGSIGEYDATTGVALSAPLVSNLDQPNSIAISGSDLYVVSQNLDTVGEYTTTGTTVNASLVSGLTDPMGIAVSGSDLFVIDQGGSAIGEYDANTGAAVSASLITGLAGASGIAISGSYLFVTNNGSGAIGEYTISGTRVSSTLVSGLSEPEGIAVSGSDLFVVNSGSRTIGEYTTSGATVSASLISLEPNDGEGLAICGSDIFTTGTVGGTISEYTTSGTTVNASLVTGLTGPVGIAVVTPLSLTTPATSTSVNVGDSFTIDWTGGTPGDTVQLWAEGGPNNAWTELTAGVPATNGSYTWDTSGVDHGWYYFQAWDISSSAPSYAVQSPDYLHIVNPAAAAPDISLSNPVLAGEAVAQGSPYTINFTATDGAGDANPIYVQLWVYSGNTGQWTVLPSANYLAGSQGFYVWDTTGMAPGWYSFAAHATNGDQWSYAASPGWLNITVPTPTIAFTTPTSGQSTAAGSTFNLDWNVTGLSTADAANATVQIWAQYLNNGSPVWTEIAASVSASGGTYAWTVPTSPGAGTYYAFSIWLNDGDMWWAQASPNWMQVS